MSDALVIEVVRKTVTVDCAVEEAFRVFTADAASWWPAESHSIHQAISEIVFEPHAGGEVYEVSESSERGHWATVLEWEPPSAGGSARLVLAWNILDADAEPTEVEVRFLPEGDGTRVELEHRGWERLAEGAEKRANYDTGWDFVLGKYADEA
jgi:Activator of Hsp90 ATPase homolog 1-like protein